MVWEPRTIISTVIVLTVSGGVGGPGVSAPSPALERMEFWGRNLVSVNVLPLNTEGRTVIQTILKRVSLVEEMATVQWTAIGILGLNGDPAVVPVVEELEGEKDSATMGFTEARIVLEIMSKQRNVKQKTVQRPLIFVLDEIIILWK